MLVMTGGYFLCLRSDMRHHWSDAWQPPHNLSSERLPENELRDCGIMVVAKEASGHKIWTEITRREYARRGQRYIASVQLFIRRLS